MLEVNGKHLHGGTFKPKDSTPEEVEHARLAAVESRRKLEEKHFTVMRSQGPHLSCPVDRASGVKGVHWAKSSGEWRVDALIKGNRIHQHFPPEGSTPEDIEHARLAAINVLQNWQRGTGPPLAELCRNPVGYVGFTANNGAINSPDYSIPYEP